MSRYIFDDLIALICMSLELVYIYLVAYWVNNGKICAI